jgi:spore germination protein KA
MASEVSLCTFVEGDILVDEFSKNASLSNRLSVNIPHLHEIFNRCDDICFRELQVGKQVALLVFVTDLVNLEWLNESVVRGIMRLNSKRRLTIEEIRNHALSVSQIIEIHTFMEVEQKVVSGHVVLLLDGSSCALSIPLQEWEHRTVDKAENEVSLRGPQQAFTEHMMNNIALIRSFVADARLKVEKSTIGNVTHTPYCIIYHESFVDSEVLEQLKQRIAGLEIDKLFDSGMLEELLKDSRWSPFPTVNYTEKPDRLVAQLLEGRIGIMVQNSPTVLTVPALFVEFLQVPEDYYQSTLLQSAVRVLRYVAFLTALVTPSLYVAVLGFHHELIPESFLSSLLEQRSGVPLPTAVEVLVMEITFEILREAGLRFPRPIGQAISIVGALVIGQAAVQARLVMASTVIVVAITGITSFTIPGYAMSAGIRMLRFPLLIATSFLGILGFILVMMMIAFHILTLRSFGVIYTSGLSPYIKRSAADTMIRGFRKGSKSKSDWPIRKSKY